MKKHLTLGLALLFCFNLFAQNKISGTLTDAEDGLPLPGAHLVVTGTYLAAVTNGTGYFEISGIKSFPIDLTVTYVGYEKQVFRIEGSAELKLNLRQQAKLSNEVVVSATRVKLLDPLTYTNLNKEEIEAQNFGQDMPFILNLTPSTVVTSDAGTGIGYTGIRIRGSDPTRINVTVNGIPLNDAESHGVFWVNMPDFASSVDNIQVQRGVGTSTNGTAFGASLNLQTNTLIDSAYGEVTASGGSFNTQRASLKFGSGLLPSNWSFDGRISRIKSDGFIDRSASDLSSYFVSAAHYGKNDIFRVNIFSGRETTQQAWNGIPENEPNRKLNTAGQYFGGPNGDIEMFYDNETDNYQQDHYQVFYTRNFNKMVLNTAAFLVRGRGYYEQYRGNDRLSNYGIFPVVGNDTIGRSDLIRRRWLDNYFYGTTFSLEWQEVDNFSFLVGGGANQYQGAHFGEVIWARFAGDTEIRDRYYENDATKTDINLYTKANYRIRNKWNTYADLQLRYIDYSFLGFNNQFSNVTQNADFLFFNPKAGVLYEHNSRNKYYASFAVGRREPTRDDFTDSSPQSRPKAETMLNTEIGWKQSNRKSAFGANFYLMDYTNQLVLSGQINDVGAFTRINVPKSYRMGVEFEAGYKFNNFVEWNGNLTLSRNRVVAYSEFADSYDADFNYLGNNLVAAHENTPIAFSPDLIAMSLFQVKTFKNFQVDLISKYVGEQFLDNSGNAERTLPAYFLNDMRINYTIANAKSWYKSMRLGLQLNNIGNVEYVSNGYTFSYFVNNNLATENFVYPQAGFNFMFLYSIGF